MMILGADPGVTGALALYDPATPDKLVAHWPMPTDVVGLTAKKNARRAVSPSGIAELLRTIDMLYAPGLFVIEKVSAGPNEGAVGAFTFGAGYGALIGAGTVIGWRMTHVTPSMWKQAMRVPADKRVAIKLAAEQFPVSAGSIREAGKRDNGGAAEAGLLALYGARVVLRLGV